MVWSETAFFWATVLAYVVAYCVNLASFAHEKPRGARVSIGLLWLALAMHTLVMIARWKSTGHAPIIGIYERGLKGSWAMVLMFLVFHRMGKASRAMGLVVIPVAFLILGYAFVSGRDILPIGPTSDSPWLVVHIAFACLAAGCFVLAVSAAALLLLKQKFGPHKAIAAMASVDSLDLTSHRFVVLGLINHAVMIVSGAMWANNLWGHYWNWDPLETSSLLVLLYFSFYLHARAFLRWEKGRAAWFVVGGVVITFVSYWGLSFMPSAIHP